MKSSVIKITISLVVALAVGAGYYVYAQPPKGTLAYVAATDLTTGDIIRPDMLRQVEVKSNIPIINPNTLVGKAVKSNIKAGEWVTPSELTVKDQKNVRYYTLVLPYEQADGPLLKEGMKVDVWMMANKNRGSQKILSRVTLAKISHEKLSPGDDATVVLALNESEIATLESAKQQSGLFLVVEGNQTP